MQARGAKLIRGWSAAGFATVTAAASHTVGGGSFPIGVAFLLALALSGLICVALAGKRVSLLRLIPAVAASQILFHWLFAILGSAGSPSLPGGTAASGHHQMQVFPVLASVSGVTTSGTAQTAAADAALIMLLAHLMAAVLTIWALRRGELTLLRLSQTMMFFFRPLWRFLVPVAPARVEDVSCAGSANRIPPVSREFFRAMRYRGPPGLRWVS